MKRLAAGAAAVALALLTFFQFPGHTWLQQDSQIYVPVLENQRDPSVLRHDLLVEHPYVAFTLYDETARLLQGITRLEFREVLALEQLATRALGTWGLYLMATALLGLSPGGAWLVAAICSLGATVTGPAVFTIEYEPTPRAFALPLVICALGLTGHRRWTAAGIAGAAAFLLHPPAALPFWALFAMARRQWRDLVPFGAAIAILLVAAWSQGGTVEAQAFFARLSPLQERLQRMRAAYVFVSTWPRAVIVHHLLLLAVVLAALARTWRSIPPELRVFLAGLPALGVATMPLSWLLLERAGWAIVPQLQPMRWLLFLTLAMQFLTAAGGILAATRKRVLEACAWLSLAFLLPLLPVLTRGWTWNRIALAAALGTALAADLRWAPKLAAVPAAAAFIAIPWLGGVVTYPRLHTPELAQLAAWARSSTPKDAVFLFPDAGRALYPGVFRSQALRAVYVDWKGGGQVNYLPDFGREWWSRWQQTMTGDVPAAKYADLGIAYVVLPSKERLPREAVFENANYAAYKTR